MQRLLWRLITDSDGVESALVSEGDAAGRQIDELLRSDRGVRAIERLSVYANAYFSRIRDSLRDDFGALAWSLGDDAFHDLIKTYLLVRPPTHPSLREAGTGLPQHLRTEPFASIFSRHCAWAAELASLERAIAEAFFAPDTAAVDREQLAGLSPDAWEDLRFGLSPSARVLECEWPVHRVREEFECHAGTGIPPTTLARSRTNLLVWRRDERVFHRAISPLEAESLRALSTGIRFGELCDRVAGQVGAEASAQTCAALFGGFLSSGLIVSIRGA